MVPFDALVVGGGHNGLVAAGYLARAGLRVCVLERYHTVGGAAISEELIPGFTVSTGSYVLSLAPRRILDELRLWDHGLELIPRDPHHFLPLPDGRSIALWRDPRRRYEELARFSRRDAARWIEYDAFVERAAAIMDRFILRPPPTWAEVAAAFGGSQEVLAFQKAILGSSADIAEHFFESEPVQALVADLGITGTFRGPRDAGTGYVHLYHAMGMATGARGVWSFVRGGMGGVTRALAAVARRAGATIRTSCEVASLLITAGRVRGVVTAEGEEIRAQVVLSNADPKRTYLGLVGRAHLPDDFVRAVEAIKMESPVLKINLALDALPRFRAAEVAGGGDGSWACRGGISIAPSIAYMQRAFEDARNGRPSDYPYMNVYAQSAVDDTMAPPGKHVLSIFAQYCPYELATGTWDTRRGAVADHVLARLAEYAPNVPGAVLARQVLAPPDIEARFGMTGGHIFHGELVPEQAFDLRPVPGSRTYEGPIRGLYLCGSGAWPGGCVMGAPGHNAAQEVIVKLKARPVA
jgi:phytoene dehydrogenase-like protein